MTELGPVTTTDLAAIHLSTAMFYYACRELVADREWPVVRGHTWTDEQRAYVLAHIGRPTPTAHADKGYDVDEAAHPRETPHMTAATAIPDFEGHPVVSTTIKVTKTGDGLSSAMNLDPILLVHGGKHIVMMEVECVDVQFPRSKDNPNNLIRKAVLEASAAMVVDAEFARTMMAEHRLRLQRAADEAAGNVALNNDGVDMTAAGPAVPTDADTRPTAAPEPGTTADGFYDAAADPTSGTAPDAAARAGVPAEGGKPTLKSITGGRAAKAPKKAGAAKKAPAAKKAAAPKAGK